jgi:hypothetical protein
MRSIFIQNGGHAANYFKWDAQKRINGKGDLHIILKIGTQCVHVAFIYLALPTRAG